MNYNITIKDFFIVYVRSFLYQNLMNDRYFQNFGFLFVLYPIVKKFHKNVKDVKLFIIRNFEYFNTNPYLVSFVFGVAMKLIKEDNDEKLKKFKFDMMSPLAALGDAISWGILKSFLVLISVSFVFFKSYSGILIFFIFYNIILTLFFRFFGLIIGYKNGLKVIFKIAQMDLQNKIALMKKIGLIIWGAVFVLMLQIRYKLIDFSFKYININDLLSVLLIVFIALIIYKLNKIVIPIVTYILFLIIVFVVNI